MCGNSYYSPVLRRQSPLQSGVSKVSHGWTAEHPGPKSLYILPSLKAYER